MVFVNRPGSDQATIAIAAEGPSAAEDDGVAFEILNTVYGGYTNSRVFRRLVLEKGWSYGPLAQVRPLPGNRAFLLVRADTANETVAGMARELIALMDGLRSNPVPDAEFRDTVGYLRGMYLLQAASGAARLQQLTTACRAGLDAEALDRYPERLSKVDSRQLQHLAGRFLGRRVIVIVGDHARLATGLSFLGDVQVIDAPPHD